MVSCHDPLDLDGHVRVLLEERGELLQRRLRRLVAPERGLVVLEVDRAVVVELPLAVVNVLVLGRRGRGLLLLRLEGRVGIGVDVTAGLDLAGRGRTELAAGQGGEGDSISDIGENSAIELFSVLTLDLSNSIGEGDLRNAVIDGALAFVNEVVTKQEGPLKHQVAIIAFGAPNQVTLEQSFSNNDSLLNAKLEQLRTSPMRGSTDLYGAYTLALSTVAPMGSPLTSKARDGPVVAKPRPALMAS